MAAADFLVTLLTVIAIYSIFGFGLNLKYGFTGLVDLGHVVYFMVGAYVAVVLTMPAGGSVGYAGIGGFDLPGVFAALVPGGGLIGWLLGVAGGMAAAALVSLLVGVPTLRLREDYLAITALGIATILNAVVHNEQWLFNGAFGIRNVYEPLSGVFPLGLGSFTLNVLVFGAISVVSFGYVAYRTALVVRGASLREGAVMTASVVVVAAGVGGMFAGGLLLAGGAVALLIGLAVGVRTLRTTDTFGPLVTLAMTELFVLWYLGTPIVTGNLATIVVNVLWLFNPTAGPQGGIDYERFVLLLSLAALAGTYWWVQRTVNSPYGRILRALREDEDVPQALGRPTVRYKTQVLMFGSALAGAAGALWALQIGFIATSQFGALITFYAFSAVIIGGSANNRGVILGTAVFWVINDGTRFLNNVFPSEYSIQLASARLILIGSLLILILYYRPSGILGEQDYDIPLPGNRSASARDAGETKEVTADD
ncbi:branched-chain amino acid ABC transporter permease [Halorarius litoreus]|uniref:branched-chain amino acid ABC transporter permease n=1 Tax=Halorarius litoreus TaxID=2962676 RepID=UPI0020CEAA7C|nr:branched-chain amino acid ABC transporter permease [Halorarius litoreus]